MATRYQELFATLDRTTVPAGLFAATLDRVRATARARARRRLAWLVAGTATTGAATGAVGYYIAGVLSTTGFYYYVSLLTTHDLAVFSYWREIAFSILATLPLFEASLFLFGLTSFVWLVAGLYQTLRDVRTFVYA